MCQSTWSLSEVTQSEEGHGIPRATGPSAAFKEQNGIIPVLCLCDLKTWLNPVLWEIKALSSALRYWQSPAPHSAGISTNTKHSTFILTIPSLSYMRHATIYTFTTRMYPENLCLVKEKGQCLTEEIKGILARHNVTFMLWLHKRYKMEKYVFKLCISGDVTRKKEKKEGRKGRKRERERRRKEGISQRQKRGWRGKKEGRGKKRKIK